MSKGNLKVTCNKPTICASYFGITFCHNWVNHCKLQSDVPIGVENDRWCKESRSSRFLDLCQGQMLVSANKPVNWLKNVQVIQKGNLKVIPFLGVKVTCQVIDIVIENDKSNLVFEKGNFALSHCVNPRLTCFLKNTIFTINISSNLIMRLLLVLFSKNKNLADNFYITFRLLPGYFRVTSRI